MLDLISPYSVCQQTFPNDFDGSTLSENSKGGSPTSVLSADHFKSIQKPMAHQSLPCWHPVWFRLGALGFRVGLGAGERPHLYVLCFKAGKWVTLHREKHVKLCHPPVPPCSLFKGVLRMVQCHASRKLGGPQSYGRWCLGAVLPTSGCGVHSW